MPHFCHLTALFCMAAVCLLATARASAAADEADSRAARAVVVCPHVFRAALEPLIAHRKAQGYTVDVIGNEGSADDIRRRIHARLGADGRRFVLLVGDVGPAKDVCVPTHHDRAEVNVLWGSPPHIATDNRFADLDGDRVPDAAVGRLTPGHARRVERDRQKKLSTTKARPISDRGGGRLNFVAGVGGFGMLADTVIESVARNILTHGIPAEYQVSMTQAAWRSPYCPDPRLFHTMAVERFNEGAAFWVYIGHGHCHHLDPASACPNIPTQSWKIATFANCNPPTGSPSRFLCRAMPALFDVGTQAADGRGTPDCLAEENAPRARRPGGRGCRFQG